jgi:hypothetical protein
MKGRGDETAGRVSAEMVTCQWCWSPLLLAIFSFFSFYFFYSFSWWFLSEVKYHGGQGDRRAQVEEACDDG